jgi:hypothetical protein
MILSVSEMKCWIALGDISLANESRKVFCSFSHNGLRKGPPGGFTQGGLLLVSRTAI